MSDLELETEMYLLWVQILEELGVAEETAVPVWQELLAGYEGDGRYYHNLAHIQHTLQIAHDLQEEAMHFTAVQLALWFHDVVYDPKQQDNEEKSAIVAGRALFEWNVPELLVAEVVRLILLTKTHIVLDHDANGRIIVDADLSGLGASPEVYDGYSRAIRQEYAFVTEEVYRNGRIQILQRFLQRPTMYYTEPMRLLFEAQARQNISRELTALAS